MVSVDAAPRRETASSLASGKFHLSLREDKADEAVDADSPCIIYGNTKQRLNDLNAGHTGSSPGKLHLPTASQN